MPNRLAVAIVHGIGSQAPNFSDALQAKIVTRFAERAKVSRTVAEEALVFQPVYWAPVLLDREQRLWEKLAAGGSLGWTSMRRFMVEFAADAIAYQPMPSERNVYTDVHAVLADALANVVKRAGPDLPLVVIAHSLGTVIASNYLYDLQESARRLAAGRMDLVPASVRKRIGDTPLERGETLAWLFTMGSPIGIWSLRYENPDFGVPIRVPAPAFARAHAGIRCGWINVYDEDDVIGYPLKGLYPDAILADVRVNVGNLLSSWNPLSHNAYWADGDVTDRISDDLADFWRKLEVRSGARKVTAPGSF
jgi:pimeloyl-ACP methyl ester carboxylesterase